MSYCPKCNSEYREEVKTCPECKIPLAEKLERKAKKEKTVAVKPRKLYSASDQIEEGMILACLKQNGIPAFKKGHGTGDYMNLYMGYSVFGEDIYVKEEDYEKAKEILEAIKAEPVEAVSTEKMSAGKVPGVEEEDALKIPFYRNRVIVARIILGVLFGSFVVLLITGIFL